MRRVEIVGKVRGKRIRGEKMKERAKYKINREKGEKEERRVRREGTLLKKKGQVFRRNLLHT
jgi:hypothetical protein